MSYFSIGYLTETQRQTSYFSAPVQVDLQSPWWMEALHYSAAKGLESDLCHRIKDELSSTDMELGSIGR